MKVWHERGPGARARREVVARSQLVAPVRKSAVIAEHSSYFVRDAQSHDTPQLAHKGRRREVQG